METSLESIRVGLVQRVLALGMAFVATSVIFTSVAVLLSAGSNGAAGSVGFVAAQTIVGT